MSGYATFTKKELTENARNYRLLLMLGLFFVFGVISPLTAKFMPEIIATFSPNMQITFQVPSALDSWEQFYSNVPSLGLSLTIILFSSCLSGEYSKGTLTIMLTKGLSRPAVVLSKFTAATAIMTVSYWLSYGVTYGYTAYFWPDAALPHLFFSAMCVWLMAVLYLCILMLGCVLFRQAFTAILFLLGVITTISLLGLVDQFAAYSPSILTNKNLDLISGEVAVSDFTIPIIIAIVLSVGLLSLAVVRFNKKQI